MKGAVAAGDPQTAEAGAQLLGQGGNATDAAVGSVLAACVAEPVLTAPFGGGFAVVAGAGAAPQAFDFFANAPGLGLPAVGRHAGIDFRALDIDFGATTQTFHVGRGSVAVPLMLPGLVELHRQRGRLPMEAVVEPAVRLARQGAIISDRVAAVIRLLGPILRLSEPSSALFAPGGRLLQAGDRYLSPQLADLLEAVGRGHLDSARAELLSAFGPPAGRLTAADLDGAEVRAHAPLEVSVGRFRVLLPPSPSSGGLLVAFGLRLLERAAPSVWSTPATTAGHLLAVMAVTNEARAQVLDPALERDGSRGLTELAGTFLSDRFVDAWRDRFAECVRAGRCGDHAPTNHLGSTTHVSAIDGDGHACAITTSNGEACGHVVPRAGALANNFMGEEDIHPRGFHRMRAGERLTSMMCPTLVLEGDTPVMALGTGGSNRIRSTLLQVLVHHLLRGTSIERAVVAPRMHYEGSCLFLERTGPGGEGFTDDLIASLGEQVRELVVFEDPINIFFGGVHAVGAGGHGAGDPRRGGVLRSVDLSAT